MKAYFSGIRGLVSMPLAYLQNWLISKTLRSKMQNQDKTRKLVSIVCNLVRALKEKIPPYLSTKELHHPWYSMLMGEKKGSSYQNLSLINVFNRMLPRPTIRRIRFHLSIEIQHSINHLKSKIKPTIVNSRRKPIILSQVPLIMQLGSLKGNLHLGTIQNFLLL